MSEVISGNPARVESTDGGGAGDHRQRAGKAHFRLGESVRTLSREAQDEGLSEVAEGLERIAQKLESGQVQQRSMDGEDSQNEGQGQEAEVIACRTHRMIVLPFEGRLSCGCPASLAVPINLKAKPNWLIEGRATMNGQLV